ncbi:MAG: nucleotidyltransferase family protein [Alphaproteobacteria bacterium]|uniref:nucleotidyltransferase family protein n=1 Tax=Brevundimonas sp. TaxID=1871086 RepID=UPI00180E5B79|nr:nucleotidyltransferase family protein [Brevundimonas sp.]MBU3969661.1 nucleotidyltransferase family protein [Alphaproteobacteria bacterium]MBA3051050.1 nucleotidyltransferase family protein [Brevundimonas sp.]MBU3974857.1 nucleotidyltransferase family protein [Alphaproteobacteria bacterium]MBU4039660.1 nucleotidyltransferase family protein [Alphaproteobacteria bacterium]MBU4136141.1 nucleotidyltransferase family protein [Alphaproteobacteria bacterium]
MSDLETRLADIVRADPGLMHVLTTVRGLGLNDWRVFSGAVYQSVWNAVTGRPIGYGRKDYDLGYFDPDVSWDAEDAVIKRVAAAFDEPFRTDVEVRNQARVHIWFPDRFGEPYEALTGTDEALARFVAPAFAVGVRLEADDTISIAAPFGLEDVFSMTLRPNPNRPVAKGWDKAVASAKARWPELTVIQPEPA